MAKNLYIDASHPNETRVVLKKDNHIEDYEYESINNTNDLDFFLSLMNFLSSKGIKCPTPIKNSSLNYIGNIKLDRESKISYKKNNYLIKVVSPKISIDRFYNVNTERQIINDLIKLSNPTTA